jgi:RNA polymerase sigma-70 factor (sigma-E family)
MWVPAAGKFSSACESFSVAVVGACVAGSGSALAGEDEFAEFVAGALPGLLRFGHVLTGDPGAAEDLVQTALGRSWRAWRLHRIDNPYAFVRKVMVNSYASWHRRASIREVVSASPAATMITADEAGRIDDRDEVWRALRSLPPRQRAVIVLRYYEDLSELEIAAVMGTSTGTVKSQCARALRRLADALTAADPARHAANGAGHD